MFEEKYKGKTVGEINQAIKALQNQYSSMPDDAKKQVEEEIAYLEGLSKKLVAKENLDNKYAGMNPQQRLIEQSKEMMFAQNNPAKKEALEESIKETVTPKTEAPYANKQQELIETSKEQMTDEINTSARKNDIKSVNDDSVKSDSEFDVGEIPETTTTETKKKEESKPEDPPKKESKGRYKSSMYGILDAMRNGDIDKSTGLYFMLDALSKAARNTGIDIGNIGAQFSGGNIRDDYQNSLWSQRRDKMFENEISSELNQQSGTDKEMSYNLAKEDLIGKGLSNEQADLALNASRTFNDKAEQFRAAGNDTLADLYALVGSAATREVGPEELAAIAASGVLNTPEGKAAAEEIMEMFKNLGGAIGGTFGGINSIMSFLTGNK